MKIRRVLGHVVGIVLRSPVPHGPIQLVIFWLQDGRGGWVGGWVVDQKEVVS